MAITVSNVVEAVFSGCRETVTRALNQYDYGQVLTISGIELPEAYEVHFSNASIGSATTSIGNAVGVTIPDQYLTTGKDVHAWIYLHAGEEDGETLYHIRIPVIRRARAMDADPTPAQQSAINQAIAALNVAVIKTRNCVEDALTAEGWAKGTRWGTPVDESSPYYHTNATYMAGQAADSATAAAGSAGDASDSAGAAAGSARDASDSAGAASGSAAAAAADALEAEGWAKGTQNGSAVASGSPYYQDNSKYYKEQAASSATAAETAAASATAAYGTTLLAPTYSTSGTYAVGDYCIYNGNMYRCTTAISSGESWTSGHWTQVAVGSEVGSLKSAINNIENINRFIYFSQTVSGTKSVIVNVNIPAGTYDVSFSSITSEDTSSTKSLVWFKYESGQQTYVFDRTATVKSFTFTADVVALYFYASNGNDQSTGKAFSFNDFTISQNYPLKEKIDELDGAVTGLRTDLDNSLFVQDIDSTTGEYTAGYWSNGEFVSDTENKSRKIDIGTAVKARIVGLFSQWYDRYDFLDASSNVLSYDRKTTSGGNEDITVDIPANTKYLCVSNSIAAEARNKKVYLIRYINESLENLQEDVSDNAETISAVNNMEIEGYEKSEWLDVTATATGATGSYAEMSNGKVVISTGNYQYLSLSVTPGEIYKTSGVNVYDMRPVIYTDDDNNILYYYPETRVTTAAYMTVESTVPEGATKLFVDGRTTDTLVIKKKGLFYNLEESLDSPMIKVSINTSETLDTTVVTERGNKFRHKLGVYNASDQPNGAVLPRSVEVYMNDAWKVIVNNEDDNCPVDLQSSYIGAGHGYDNAYKITLSSHGKTYADIGSKWQSGNQYQRYWWIVRIIDENNLVILGENDSNAYDTRTWGDGDTLTHVSGATHTGTMSGFTKASFLLTPVDKNHTKKVMLDGITYVNTSGQYEANEFVDIIEEYDVINPQSIVSQVLANMPSGGYTENPAINTGATFLHFSNVYRILADGTMILFTTLDNDVNVSLTYWGGTQYAQKSSASEFGGALFRYVPKLLPVTVSGSSKDLRTPFNMANWNFTIDATTEYWEDENNPPDRLLHLFTNGSGNYVAGFAVGYLPIANGSASVRKTNISNAMYLYSTKKAYFHMVDSGGANAGTWTAYTPLQSIIYRKPVLDVANAHTDAYFIPLGDVCYMYVDYHATADDRVKVPAEYVGKPMTIVEKSDNVTVYGTVATDEIRIRCTTASPMYGYAVVKIGN